MTHQKCYVLRLRILCFLAVLTVSWFFTAPPAYAKKAKLSSKKLTMEQYTVKKLKLNNARGKVKWKSSDPSVATVSKKGKVKAINAGTCTIRATCRKKKYNCQVTVTPFLYPDDELFLTVKRTMQLELDPALLSADSTADGTGNGESGSTGENSSSEDGGQSTDPGSGGSGEGSGQTTDPGSGSEGEGHEDPGSGNAADEGAGNEISDPGNTGSEGEGNEEAGSGNNGSEGEGSEVSQTDQTETSQDPDIEVEKTGDVEWISSNPGVATVSQTGLVKGISEGTCVINACYNNGITSFKIKVLAVTSGNLRISYRREDAPKKAVLLAGSSSVDFWESAPGAFDPYPVINMGINGTRSTRWMELYEELIVKYDPAAVVLYVGANDIGKGNRNSGKKTGKNVIKLLSMIHQRLPGVPIYYISIHLCWGRQYAWKRVRIANKLIKAYCDATADVHYADVVSAFVRSDGKPNPLLFRSDQIHPNADGYEVWKEVVAEPLVAELKRRGL